MAYTHYMLDSQYAYLLLCGIYFLVWCVFFLARKDIRKELCVITLFTAPLGFTEWLYYDYFRPDFLFPLLPRIGVEDFLWAGIVSGIGAVGYELIARRRTYHVRNLTAGWLGGIWLSTTVVLGLLLFFIATNFFFINSAHLSIAGFLLVTLMIILWRRDLLPDAILSGIFLSTLTFIVYWIWMFFFPNAFADYWQLHNTFGIFIHGIPIEELLYTFGWGSVIGPMYELMEGLRLRKLKR